MKIKRLVGLLADLTPHAYSDNVVLMWLSNCENSILTDVFLIAPEETVEYEAITEDKLLVPHPYDKLYLPYLQAQVAHANQEYDLYANLIALYNAYRYEYAQYIVHGADPGSGDAVARGYFLSAYGVAVAHGYDGSEEEWLRSLKGATGERGADGKSAYETAKEQGFDGTEAEWLASLEGKSAYEVALEEGFEGTASEWLESIKGPAGRSTVLAYAPADGQSYTAQAEGVVAEQGCEIVLVPQSTNQGAATLSLNDGEAYPLCLRPGSNVSENELRPQLTLPLEAGMLLRGGEYIFRFDGAAWVLQSYVVQPGVYVQDEEPENAQEGDVWIDTDEEPEEADTVTAEELEEALSIATQEQKAYVDEAVAELTPIDITDTVTEWMIDEEFLALSMSMQLATLAVRIYEKYEPGNYVAFDGIGKYEVYYSENLSRGGVRMKLLNSTADLFFDELGKLNGFVFVCQETAQEMLIFAAGEPVAFSPTGLAEPTEDSGAANKKYVDDAIAAALDGIALAEEGAY